MAAGGQADPRGGGLAGAPGLALPQLPQTRHRPDEVGLLREDREERVPFHRGEALRGHGARHLGEDRGRVVALAIEEARFFALAGAITRKPSCFSSKIQPGPESVGRP